MYVNSNKATRLIKKMESVLNRGKNNDVIYSRISKKEYEQHKEDFLTNDRVIAIWGNHDSILIAYK